jgi:hypothetical protein
MKSNTAYLINKTQMGKNVAKLTNMIAVFSAAVKCGVFRAKCVVVVT